MASACMSRLAKFCRRCRARSDLYRVLVRWWTVYELACFLSPFDVVVSENIRDKFQQSSTNLWMVLSSIHRQSGGLIRC